MNELELKYGCNPNQKPARIFMRDGSDLPLTVLNGKPGYINFLDALNARLEELCLSPVRVRRPASADDGLIGMAAHITRMEVDALLEEE